MIVILSTSVLLNFLLAIWVLLDSQRRKNSPAWSVGVFFLGLVVFPLYLAKRNLQTGEVREGGTSWNVSRSFALIWTVYIGFGLVDGTIKSYQLYQELGIVADEWEAGFQIFGVYMSARFIAAIWFVVILAVLVIGIYIKQSSVVETGPTGRLAIVDEFDENELED